MTPLNLFGHDTPLPVKPRADRAHAAMPGAGPQGEMCKTCLHYCRVNYHDKVWLKCGLVHPHWTHGPGTDIRAHDPACSKWEMMP